MYSYLGIIERMCFKIYNKKATRNFKMRNSNYLNNHVVLPTNLKETGKEKSKKY